MSSSCVGFPKWESPSTITEATTGETLNLTHVFNRYPVLTTLHFQAVLMQRIGDTGNIRTPILNYTIFWDPSTPFGPPSTQDSTSPVWAPINKTCLTAVYYIWRIPSDVISDDRSAQIFFVSSRWDLTSDNDTFSSPGSRESDDFVIRKPAVAAPVPTDNSTTVANTSTSDVSLGSDATSTPGQSDSTNQLSTDAGTMSFGGRLGIGIAVPLLVCMLFLVGWWLWRRRRLQAGISPPTITSPASTSERTRFEKAELDSPAVEQLQELDGKHLVEVDGHRHGHGSSASGRCTYELDASQVPLSPSVPKRGNVR
ncbi:uncharacterized protein B0I36DRAFT_97891 [Microdochium trichocladiopsis]|uniref:Mid2 domain-containing protein n=1 Tax=Microdochium trichocladiopsis TaxID=1682393 RepID=A0A9P8YFC2_9PEZI|nr:uncharacterized protein B0I36DRAFT_97891 [Microdochium trichocladiopsis]KAH7035921.1 hypothetical protein B0I36DRAFT_97891 [Microdochium trichocladiopsis]